MTNVQTATTQADATPAGVIQWLRAGNDRFTAGEPTPADLLDQAAATADGQFPLAAVLGCIDSRVPVEAVFGVGIGDIFVGRSAGNVVDDDVIGGFEFATELAGAKAIVVLGHTACGAVRGACDGAELGHLTQLLDKIRPAVDAAAAEVGANPGSGDTRFVTSVIERNVRNSIGRLRTSEVISAREQRGDLTIVGAVYELASGSITWLD